MPLAISFELSDRDLEHFNAAIKAARDSAGNKPAEEIIAAAGKLLEDANKVELPDFISARLVQLDSLIAMVRDVGWSLNDEDRQHVLSALVYFADPTDIIPDSIPVLGYFDDAIAIELCVRELKNELEAYEEFCEFRENEARRRGVSAAEVANGLQASVTLAAGTAEGDVIVFTVTSPDNGTAAEELPADYASDQFEIGFNANYLKDILSQIDGDNVEIHLADAGAPTLIRQNDKSPALYVLMPMRV